MSSIWLGHTSLVVENCEDVWASAADVTIAVSTDVKVGTYSVAITAASNIASGTVLAYENVSSVDLSSYTHFCLWVKSSVALAAGALVFCIDEDNALASPSETLSLPALVADQWTAVVVACAAASSTRNATLSVGLKTGATLASGAIVYVDDVRTLTARQFTNVLAVRGLNRPDEVIHSKAQVVELIDGDMYEVVPVKSRRVVTLEFNALTSEVDQYWLESFIRQSEKRVIGTNDNVVVVYGDAGAYGQEWLNNVSIGRRPVLKFIEKSGWSTQPSSWSYA